MYIKYSLHVYTTRHAWLYTVPGPVSNLSATTTVTQLTVTWSPPSEPNGVIIVYELHFSLSNEICSCNSLTTTVNTSATQQTLRDLSPNTVVAFSVRAYTIIGPGEFVTGQASTKLTTIMMHVCVSV